jgi:hypothetical protein
MKLVRGVASSVFALLGVLTLLKAERWLAGGT